MLILCLSVSTILFYTVFCLQDIAPPLPPKNVPLSAPRRGPFIKLPGPQVQSGPNTARPTITARPKISDVVPLKNYELIPRNNKQRSDDATTESGDIAKHCVCSKIYDPVCASNKKSYYNRCQFQCEVGNNDTVSILHQGNCIPY